MLDRHDLTVGGDFPPGDHETGLGRVGKDVGREFIGLPAGFRRVTQQSTSTVEDQQQLVTLVGMRRPVLQLVVRPPAIGTASDRG